MTHRLPRFTLGAIFAASLSLAACGGGANTTPDANTGPPDANTTPDANRPPDANTGTPDANAGTPDANTGGTSYTGSYSHYITNQIKVGVSSNEADAFAFDLDGKAPMKDNVIGHVLSGLNNQLHIDDGFASALGKGQFVVLHSVHADDLVTDPSVAWQIYIGTPYTTGTMPNFDGHDMVTIRQGSDTSLLLPGSVSGGLFCSKPGCTKDGKMGDGVNAGKVTVSLSLSADSDPFTLTFYAARLEAKVTANGCTEGRIGGGVKSVDIASTVLPALAANLDARIAADDGCRADFSMCTPDDQTILGIFDTDSDRHITVTEVQNNAIIKSVLMPDLDLLPEKGPSGSNAESVSIALGFTCTGATYTAAHEP